MDLIGFPIRVTIGDKNLPNVEVKVRNQSEAQLIPLEEAGAKITQIVKEAIDALNKTE